MSVTIGAVVNIILNVPLIMWLGTEGAMISTVISEFSVTLYQFYIVRRELDLLQMMQDTWKYLLSGLIMFITVLTMNIRLPFSMVQLVIQALIGVIIYCGILYFMNPRILKYLIKNKK